MNWPIEILLVGASTIGAFGLFRMMISIATTNWHNALHDQIQSIPDWSCQEFHRIMSQPRPWYVVVSDWMQDHHV